jgi:hypothetical protein
LNGSDFVEVEVVEQKLNVGIVGKKIRHCLRSVIQMMVLL